MHHARIIYGTLHVESRENNSASGNPRYRVHVRPVNPDAVAEAYALTRPDDAMAYGIENPEISEQPAHYRVGILRGRWHVEAAPELDATDAEIGAALRKAAAAVGRFGSLRLECYGDDWNAAVYEEGGTIANPHDTTGKSPVAALLALAGGMK